MVGAGKALLSLTFYVISPTSPSSVERSLENISPRSAEILNSSDVRSDGRNALACVSSYERKSSVVHDTVYQQRCINVTLPTCHITHIPATRPAIETRCVPSYSTRCKFIKKKKFGEECRMEYKAECSQVFLQKYKTDYRTECDRQGVCNNVALQQKPTAVPRHKCQSVRQGRGGRRKCRNVPQIINEKKCVYLPIQSCKNVPVQVNVDIPKKNCTQVVRTHCQNVPVQIARVVGRLVPVPKLNCPQQLS